MCKKLLFLSLVLVLLPWKLFSLDPGDDIYTTSLRFIVYLEHNKIDSALMLVKVDNLKKYRRELEKAHKEIAKVTKESYPDVTKVSKQDSVFFICDYVSKKNENYSNYRVYIFFADSTTSVITRTAFLTKKEMNTEVSLPKYLDRMKDTGRRRKMEVQNENRNRKAFNVY